MSDSANVWNPKDPVATISNYSSVVTQRFVATSGQITFNIDNFAYVPGTKSLLIYKDGALLSPEVDVIETDGDTFTLTSAATTGQIIDAVGFIGSINAVVDPYYLGPKAAAPTVDNQGITLGTSHEGYHYWNTTSDDSWTWTGTVWQLTSSSVATSANLVSVADAGSYFTATDVETALQELGASTGAAIIGTVDAGDYFSETTVETQIQKLAKINSLKYSGSVLTPYKNLILKNTVANPTYQVDIDVDNLIVEDFIGRQELLSAINLTVDITANGDSNGLDTLPGTGEVVSTWYHLWVIYDGTTTQGLLSLSSTAPTMPSGYTYKGYVGAIYNDSGSDFLDLYQVDNKVALEVTTDLSAGTATTRTSVTITVPPTAKKGRISVTLYNNTGASAVITCDITPENNIVGQLTTSIYGVTGQYLISALIDIILTSASTLYYKNNVANVQTYININGWEY